MDTDPFTQPLCHGIENHLASYCGDDIFTCMDLMCNYITRDVVTMYESDVIQKAVRINLVLVVSILTVMGVVLLMKRRYRI